MNLESGRSWNFSSIEEIKSRPPIVTICGPRKFKEQILQEQRRLERDFCIVHIPNFSFESEEFEKFSEENFEMLHEQHYRKMLSSDSIYIVDVDGYIGNDTMREIAFAHRYEIPVKYMEDPKVDLSNI